jgi:hypothetical protein
MRAASPLTPGLAAWPKPATRAFASTQAAWRFYRNPRLDLTDLVAPLHQAAHQELAEVPAPYALVVIDWSNLNFHTHTSKTDQILFSQGSDRGYELSAALLVDTLDGNPIAPLELRLRTADAVFSTRRPLPRRSASHLDQVWPTMRAIAELQLPTTPVYVIDCEADSVDHLRCWQRQRQLFLVRTDGTRTVRFEKQHQTLKDVVATLQARGAFGRSREVLYHGQKATQTVAEVSVVLDKPAYRRGPGSTRRVIPGKALPLRLVVSLVHDAAGNLLATWCLLTNLPAAVTTSQVALWYYWRWRIESFFKLLKSAGQELESWQQETGAAIARRLLVACMACVAVWQVARAPGAEAETLRSLLVRLSGRQMKYGVAFTLPALLAGTWVLLSMLEVLEHHDLDELRRLAQPLRRAAAPANGCPSVPTDSS